MRRSHLEHILRASGAIVAEEVIIVIGSQAILASIPSPPQELIVSIEANVYPRDAPEKADLIEGAIGELSMFHETFGYYADGVSPSTAVLPSSWRDRLVPLRNENTGGVTGLCLSPVDIAVSKLAAGRKKDVEYVRALMRHGIVTKGEVTALLDQLAPEQRVLVESRLTVVTP